MQNEKSGPVEDVDLIQNYKFHQPIHFENKVFRKIKTFR